MKKTPVKAPRNRGFTLIELMVAMGIVTIIVTILISVTAIALDAWNRSRSELRAARQAKAMVEAMARDFESLVSRRGNTSEWLFAKTNQSDVGNRLVSSNAAELIFFTTVTDRYDGQVNTVNDLGGDVSCVAYELAYKDPINNSSKEIYKTFVLNRLLVNPDETFQNLLGTANLETSFGQYRAQLAQTENFVCENVYQFSTTFHVEVSKNVGSAQQPRYQSVIVPVSLGSTNSGVSVSELSLKGSGIDAAVTGQTIGSTTISADEIRGGRIAAVEISLTVLTDAGIAQQRTRSFTGNEGAFLQKNSFQYSKRIEIPTM